MLLVLTNEPRSCSFPGWNLMSADGMKRSYSTDKTPGEDVYVPEAVEKDQLATPSELNRSRNSSRLGAALIGFSRPSGNRFRWRGLLSLQLSRIEPDHEIFSQDRPRRFPGQDKPDPSRGLWRVGLERCGKDRSTMAWIRSRCFSMFRAVRSGSWRRPPRWGGLHDQNLVWVF